MDDREAIEKLTTMVYDMSLDVQKIKVTQPNVIKIVESFTAMYTNIDSRLRVIEISGHECKNSKTITEFKQFIDETNGYRKGQRPLWESFRNGVTTVVVAVIMLVLGFIANGGGK
jgi:hypothetical protein